MALRDCPVCHASVKLENLERHVANVHPRQKPSLAISADERRIIREKRSISTPGFHIPRPVLVMILAVPSYSEVSSSPILTSRPAGATTGPPHAKSTVSGTGGRAP